MAYELDERYDSALGVQICEALGWDLHGKTRGMVATSHGDHGHKSPCLYVYLDNNGYRCYSCGQKGLLTSLYWDEFGRSAYRDFGRGSFAGDPTVNPFANRAREVAEDYEAAPKANFKFEGTTVDPWEIEKGNKFIRERGFTEAVMRRAKAKYCISGYTTNDLTDKDYKARMRIDGRIMIPIYEAGKLLSIECRDVDGEDAWREVLRGKRLNPDEHVYKKVLYPKGSSSNTLYRYSYLKTDEAFCVEGIMDAMSLMCEPETRNATATFHAIPSTRQFYLLKKFEKVIYLPHNDEAGENAVESLRKEWMSNVWILKVPSDVDDVNDVQRGRCERYRSVRALIDDGWLESARRLRDC
jgi:hypothetical protein